MIQGSLHQEDITIVNIYVPKIGEPKYIKQILTDLKGGIAVKQLGLQYPTFNNGQTIQIQNQWGNNGCKLNII